MLSTVPGAGEFRSRWFVESLATQTLVIFAIRTRRIPSAPMKPGAAQAREGARRLPGRFAIRPVFVGTERSWRSPSIGTKTDHDLARTAGASAAILRPPLIDLGDEVFGVCLFPAGHGWD